MVLQYPQDGDAKMLQILLVDDDKQICRLVGRYLEQAGFAVASAYSAGTARKLLKAGFFDLGLFDIMLPDGSGLDLAQTAREEFNLPVIMMTARGDIDDKSKAFRGGADDYIVKPFDPNELVLRVQAVLKRVAEAGSGVIDPVLHKPKITLGRPETAQLSLDADSQTVYMDNKYIDMPRREFQLLSFLAINKNHTLSREQIVDHLWGIDFAGELRVVDLYIDRLRKRLKTTPEKKSDWCIKTVRGTGYRLEVEP